MPVETISRVLDRARGNLNDQETQIWSDNRLLPHLCNAYEWAYSKIAVYEPSAVRKTVGEGYTDSTGDILVPAGTSEITSLLPIDLYLPETFEYRLAVGDNWIEVSRRSSLPSIVTSGLDGIACWVWQNRRVYVSPPASDVRLRFTYLSLFPHVDDAGEDVANRLALDNVIAALAYFAASSAYASRGQTEQAKAMMGSAAENEFPGALGMMELAIGATILNQQLIPRRGVAFSHRNWT